MVWARESAAAAIALDRGESTSSPAASLDAGLEYSRVSMHVGSVAVVAQMAVGIAAPSAAPVFAIAFN